MRKALTIIELIFTIVILGLVFTVIPRIVYVSNKSIEVSATEEAVFNMMAKMSDIVFKEWDENNTQTDEILIVNDPVKNEVTDCNKDTGYRIGGFDGGRNCKDDQNKTSHIGADDDEPPYDDIDDYNGTEENTTSSGRKKKTFILDMFASYVDEWNASNYNSDSFSYKFDKNELNKSNIKRVKVVVSAKGEGNISTIKYYGANIGHAIIASESW